MRHVVLAAAFCIVLTSIGCTSTWAPRPPGKIDACPSWVSLLYPSATYETFLAQAKPDMVYATNLSDGTQARYAIWAQTIGKQGPWMFKLGRVYYLLCNRQVCWGLLNVSPPIPPAEARTPFVGKFWAESFSYPGRERGEGNSTFVDRIGADASIGSIFRIDYASDNGGTPNGENMISFLLFLGTDRQWRLAAAGDFADTIRTSGPLTIQTKYDLSVIWAPKGSLWPFEAKVVEHVVYSQSGEKKTLPAVDIRRDGKLTGEYPMSLKRDDEQYVVADGKGTLRDIATLLAGYFSNMAELPDSAQATAVTQWQLKLVQLNPDTDPYKPLAQDMRVVLPEPRIFGEAVRSAVAPAK